MADKHEHDHRFFGKARGSYAIQVIYFIIFTGVYIWLFWELSLRWPLR
ncbi:MAG: hypothetical protein IT318_05030 [Anaerolineales bacterium]|nr:hypothetical protein [Anaerolineales bacterium]